MLSCRAGWPRITLSAPFRSHRLFEKKKIGYYVTSPPWLLRKTFHNGRLLCWLMRLDKIRASERVFMRLTRPLATAGQGVEAGGEHRSSGSQPPCPRTLYARSSTQTRLTNERRDGARLGAAGWGSDPALWGLRQKLFNTAVRWEE